MQFQFGVVLCLQPTLQRKSRGTEINKYVGPTNCQAQIYAGRVACCPLVSHDEYAYADGTDRRINRNNNKEISFLLYSISFDGCRFTLTVDYDCVTTVVPRYRSRIVRIDATALAFSRRNSATDGPARLVNSCTFVSNAFLRSHSVDVVGDDIYFC